MMTILAETMFRDAMMGLAVLLLLMILVANVRRRTWRQTHQKLTPREQVERAKEAGGIRNDLRKVAVELEEVSRHFSSQLDARAIRLEKLIEEADAKIRRLEALAGSEAGATSGRDEEPAAGSGTSGGRARSGRSTGRKGRSEESAGAAVMSDQGGGVDPLTRKVYDLADEGRTPLQIAQDLSEHVGKVELILALRQG